MPRINFIISKDDLALLRNLAAREGRTMSNTCCMLVHMSLEMIQHGERKGLYNIHVPLVPAAAGRSKRATWTKEQRDNWILTGQEPERITA
jgi:hypothetical protein